MDIELVKSDRSHAQAAGAGGRDQNVQAIILAAGRGSRMKQATAAKPKCLTEVGGKATFRPAWGVLMAQASDGDRGRRGRIISQLSAAEDAGTVAGPILAGLLWSTYGVAALLGARMILAVLAELYALVLYRKAHYQGLLASAPPASSRGET